MGAVKFKAESKFDKALSRSKWILSSFFEQWKNYGFSIAFPSFVWWIGNYGHKPSISFWALKRLTVRLDHFFEKKYQDVISKYSSCPDFSGLKLTPCDNYCIWVFWWQGEHGMPNLVRSCFHQLVKHNDNVILITKDNIQNYTNIPQEIYTKIDQGKISITHLSDILRLSLLAEKGGMWLDATCFVPYSIPEKAKKEIFYSPSTNGLKDIPLWSNSRWCTYNMGTNAINNPLFMLCRDLFLSINIKETCLPHYLTMDYLIDYAYRKIPAIKTMIDNHTEYNTKRNELHFLLNKPYDEATYQKLIENDWVFKLSYKSIWKKEVENKITFYGKLLTDTAEED